MQTWKTIIEVPLYMIIGMGDSGIVESYEDSNELIDSDDLRITLKLSGGTDLLLPGNGRLMIDIERDCIRVEVLHKH